ncbi:hypothetical protein BDC45DRAFT_510256 [Circinella umbellata]|nr:hypothetical protein BDC45DRAFT_510256 [Circinella umbellata]
MASVVVAFSCLMNRLSKINSTQQLEEKDLKRLDQLVIYGRRLFLKGEYNEAYRLFYRLEQSQPHIRTTCKQYQIQCLMELRYFTQALTMLESIIDPPSDQDNTQLVSFRSRPRTSLPSCSLDWFIMGSDVCFAQGDYANAVDWLQRGCQRMGWPIHEAMQESILNRKRLAQEKLARTSKGQYYGREQQQQRQDDPNNKYMSKRIDFVKILPYDIISTIFQRMPFDCIVRCTWVSKRWHAYLIKSLHLWQNLDFSFNDMPVEPESLRLYLSRLDGAPLKRIKIHHECVDGDALLATLLEHKNLRLQELDLSEVVCTPSLFYNLLTSMGPTLKVLKWRGLILKLGNIIDYVAESCMQLKHLEVRQCFVSDKSYEETTRPMMDITSSHGPGYYYHYFSKSFLDNIVSTTKPLMIESLTLAGIHELTMTKLAHILHRCPKLTQLSLENCILDIVPVTSILFHSCPMLERLRYSRHRYVQQYHQPQHEEMNSTSWIASSTTTGNRTRRSLLLSPLTNNQMNKHVIPSNIEYTVVGKRVWKELAMVKAPTATDAMLQRLLYRADLTQLERIDFTGNSNFSDKALEEILNHNNHHRSPLFLNLRKLCLGGCTRIVKEQTLLDLLKACPQLTHIDFSEISAVTDKVVDQITHGSSSLLHAVHFTGCQSITDASIKRLVDKRKNTLVKLEVSRASISIETNGYVMSKLKL